MTIEPTPLDGLSVLQRHPIGDQRGYNHSVPCLVCTIVDTFIP
jgi:hypothetical protein